MASDRPELALLPIRGSQWAGVRYGCTTREGGVSDGAWASFNLGLHTGDERGAVIENRRRLAASLPGEPFWLEQVHGCVVADADVPTQADVAVPRADAAVTMQPGRVLAIMTADCVPVVIADMQGRALGMAHAGWRGLAAGVLEATVQALTAKCAGGVWRAWVGPCIGQRHYEVGDELRHAFVDADAATARFFSAETLPGKWQADLAGLARHRLEMIGMYSVEVAGLCTYEHAGLFYSYRRAAETGRMATLAWIEPL